MAFGFLTSFHFLALPVFLEIHVIFFQFHFNVVIIVTYYKLSHVSWNKDISQLVVSSWPGVDEKNKKKMNDLAI